MPKVILEKKEHYYELTLDAPPLNILDLEMLDDLRAAIGEVKNDRHVLLITGAGERAFSAGASVQDHLGDRVARMLERFHDCFRSLNRLELVTVAMVRGLALGGGCELAMACDFVLASDTARFGQPEISLGVFPPVAAWQLSRQLPPRLGLDLLLRGETIDGSTAARLGLVNATFSGDRFREECFAWLEAIFQKSASSLRFAKRAFRVASSDDFDARLADIERLYLQELMASADAAEGLAAFLEKRKPVWRDR